MTIKAATPDDIPDILEMLSDLFTLESDFTPDPNIQYKAITLMLESPELSPIWVTDISGCIAGMCTLQILISTACGSKVGLIEDVYVKPEFRRQGIGRALLDHAQTWARQNNLARLQLLCDTTNQCALDFYEKSGWSRTQLLGIRKFM